MVAGCPKWYNVTAMGEMDRHLLTNGICAMVGTGAPPKRVVATRDLIESGWRLGDAIASPNNPDKSALVTFAALGLLFAAANAVNCQQRSYW